MFRTFLPNLTASSAVCVVWMILVIALAAHHPSRKVSARKLRFGVSRGQTDDQALELALCDLVELVTNDFVMTAQDALGPHMLNKLDEVVLALVLLLHLVIAREQRQGFVLILLRLESQSL
jgi:hypothetical protein